MILVCAEEKSGFVASKIVSNYVADLTPFCSSLDSKGGNRRIFILIYTPKTTSTISALFWTIKSMGE